MKLTAFLTAVTTASALYFHITEGTPRCFIEEVPNDTLIVGTYKNPDFIPYGQPRFDGVGVHVIARDGDRQTVLSKSLENEGKFAFSSVQGGEYSICFQTNTTGSSRVLRKFRLDLQMDVGETGIDYTEVARKEHLTELEVEIRRLNDKIKDIAKEQAYQRAREVQFRDTSESTNARVQWWSIAQTLVMVAAGIYQIAHLKSFFQHKKIV